MAKFIKLQRRSGQGSILVNINQLQSVIPDDASGGSVLFFGQDDSVRVVEEFEDISKELDRVSDA